MQFGISELGFRNPKSDIPNPKSNSTLPQQFSQLLANVGRAHQRFSDEYRADAGLFKSLDIGASVNAALADQHAVGGNTGTQ